MFYEGISAHHGTTLFLFDIKHKISSALCIILVQFYNSNLQIEIKDK